MDRVLRNRRLIAVAVGGGIVAAGIAGVAAFRPASSSGLGPTLTVAVVTPPTPAIQAGSVMDVGELADGYVHREPPPPETYDWVEADYDDGADLWAPEPSRAADWGDQDRDASEPARAVVIQTPDSMGFGFHPVAEPQVRIIRSAPPERTPADAPPVTATGERGAMFY